MTVELIPGEFSQFTIAIAIISGFIVIFGYVSIFVKERLFISEACKWFMDEEITRSMRSLWCDNIVVALVVGIIAGPLVANGIDPYSWDDMNEITKQITRCVIAIQVIIIIVTCWINNEVVFSWLRCAYAGHGCRDRVAKVSTIIHFWREM